MPDFEKYCDKNIFRDDVEVNIHDLGLNVSADITSTDNNVYIYSSDEKVPYSKDIVFSKNHNGFSIHEYGNTCNNNDVDFDELYDKIVARCGNDNIVGDIENTILYDSKNTVYTFEDKYLSSFKESITLLTYETYNEQIMNLENVSSIKINKDWLPLYVYSDSKLVDVLMEEESMCGRLIAPDNSDAFYYIPFYYKTNTEGGTGDIKIINFLNAKGEDVTSILEYNKYNNVKSSDFWKEIEVDGV